MPKTYFSTLLLTLSIIFCSSEAAFSQNQFKALVFSKTKGFRHQSIPDGVVALKKLARDNVFQIYTTEDEDYITDKNLAEYDVIILMSTTGTIFNEKQKNSIEKFIFATKINRA